MIFLYALFLCIILTVNACYLFDHVCSLSINIRAESFITKLSKLEINIGVFCMPKNG